MNIAFITPEYVTEKVFDGGIANYIYKISFSLTKLGHRVFVIVLSDEDKVFNDNNVTVIRVNKNTKFTRLYAKIVPNRFQLPLLYLYHSLILNKALKKLNKSTTIDVAQYVGDGCGAYFRPKYIPSVVRVACYCEGMHLANEKKISLKSKLSFYLQYASIKKGDVIFAPSFLVANTVKNKINRKIEVVESPLPLKGKVDTRVYDDILKGKKYLLFFGTLGVYKGLKEISDILPELLSSHKSLYFVFVGKSQAYQGQLMIQYIWDKAGEYRGRCVFLGKLRHNFLQPILENSYAVVLPSRVDNFPNACTESMAKGKIVIGTRGASFDQLIEDKKNGFLCDIQNPQSLLEAVNKALSLSPSIKKKIELAARNTVRRLDHNKIAKEFEDLYIKAIKKRQGRTD